jgi:hypothetical protein
MKHTLRYLLPALCTAAVCLGSSLSASAYTADDVAAKARAAGWPEYLIQAGYNEWASGNYSQSDLDKAYNSVSQYDQDTGELIRDALGVSDPSPAPASDAPSNAATDAPTNAETAAPASQAADLPAETNAPAPQQTAPAPAPAATVTKTDGTTEERVSKADFIQMTIEEKKDYVASLSEESKQEFMGSLSSEERNSIIKQLPAEDKAALIQSYVDTAKDMGMNVAVDSITDNNVSMTIRNEDGQVIGKTAVGTIIDETGISHTAQFLTAFLAALTAVFGFMMIYRYLARLD